VELLVKICLDAQCLGVSASVAHGRLCRLLHDVAKLSCKSQVAAAPGQRGLDIKDLTSSGCPRQTGGNPDLMMLLFRFGQELRRAKKAMQVTPCNTGQLVFAFGEFARDLAADRGELSFEIAQAGFLGVLGDDA